MIHKPSKVKRHKGKLRMETGINIVSMIDILTVLILFLLVQSSYEEVLSASKSLQLPVSTSETTPQKTVTILVNRDQIAIEGVPAGDVKKILQDQNPSIPELEKELQFHAKRTLQISRFNPSVQFQGKVTIMGDRAIPFAVLKKIMVTCSRAGYPNISLAVLQKEKEKT